MLGVMLCGRVFHARIAPCEWTILNSLSLVPPPLEPLQEAIAVSCQSLPQRPRLWTWTPVFIFKELYLFITEPPRSVVPSSVSDCTCKLD